MAYVTSELNVKKSEFVCACIMMQVKMKPELALIQFAVFNHWAVTLINYQATSYLFYFGNYLGPNIQTGSE